MLFITPGDGPIGPSPGPANRSTDQPGACARPMDPPPSCTSPREPIDFACPEPIDSTVLSHFMILLVILEILLDILTRSFYNFVNHSWDHVSYFAIMLNHFIKLLSHSQVFVSHSLKWLTWDREAESVSWLGRGCMQVGGSLRLDRGCVGVCNRALVDSVGQLDH
jgi:hypothetical protein